MTISHDQLKNSTKAMFDGIRSNPKLTLNQFRDLGAQKIGFQHFGELKSVINTTDSQNDPKLAVLAMAHQLPPELVNQYLKKDTMGYVVFYDPINGYFVIDSDDIEQWCEDNEIYTTMDLSYNAYPHRYIVNNIESQERFESELEAQINAYHDILLDAQFDIGNLDIFQCQCCKKHFDIDDSFKNSDDELECNSCTDKRLMCFYRVSIFEDKGDSKTLTCFETALCEESAEDCALSSYPNGEVKHIEAISEDDYNDAIAQL
jgi:hypothetical protein